MTAGAADKRQQRVVDPSGGANQSRVRAYNERLVLSLVRRHGALPKSQIARRSGLSAQTVTVIMRSLEADGLLLRGEPQRGRVGQPSIPMSLDPEGAFSIGLKIGRRSAELVLIDFTGSLRASLRRVYSYPTPDEILRFAVAGITKLCKTLGSRKTPRVAGVGISMPFELWSWAEKFDVPTEEMLAWKHLAFGEELASQCGLPVYVLNDATSACGAELAFGRGSQMSDFVYFFVGTFVGGGIVINNALFSGRSGNAGALGTMPVPDADGNASQLIDHSSVYGLEQMIIAKGKDPSPLWEKPDDWSIFSEELDEWSGTAAGKLAWAIVASCTVIDFSAAIIDGAFSDDLREQLVRRTSAALDAFDLQGIRRPQILPGTIGRGARAVGGAGQPLLARYLLDQNVLFKT